METIKSIKEKAKAYDRAVEQMRSLRDKLLNDGIIKEDGVVNSDFQRIFPELKESEDERIRKSIIGFLKTVSSLRDEKTVSNKDFDSKELLIWTAWLEKQGEQNHTDKVEPKFKVGDIIYKPSNSSCPVHSSIDGTLCTVIEVLDKHYILDTNEGRIQESFAWQDYYELVKQKPAWSEEDSPYYDDICEILINLLHSETADVNKDAVQKDLDWLISLKDRVQPKKEWSEDDEKAINDIMWIIEVYRENGFSETHKQMANNAEKWLKSLRPQNTWKPSDEQMKQLSWIAEQNKNNMIGKELMTLYQDLKKLREE